MTHTKYGDHDRITRIAEHTAKIAANDVLVANIAARLEVMDQLQQITNQRCHTLEVCVNRLMNPPPPPYLLVRLWRYIKRIKHART